MDSTSPEAWTLSLNKFTITFTIIFYPHHNPGPASAPPMASPDINPKLFHHFLSILKLPGVSPSPAIADVSTEPILEDIYFILREEIDPRIKLYGLNVGHEAPLPQSPAASRENMSLIVFESRSLQAMYATHNTMTITASQYLPLSSRTSKRGSTSQKIQI